MAENETHQGSCNRREPMTAGGDTPHTAATRDGPRDVPDLPKVEKPSLMRPLGVVDITAMRASVERLSETVWRRESADYERENLVLEHTQYIGLRFIGSSRTPLDFSSTPIWTIWRRPLFPVMQQATAPYGFAEPCYPVARLERIKAGHSVRLPADEGIPHTLTHRVHLPLQTAPRAMLTVGDADFPLEPGHALEINNLLPSGVSNGSDRDCIQLVFEVFEGASHARYCPICNTSSFRFQDAGRPWRGEAECSRCGSRERHRLIYLYLQRVMDLFSAPPSFPRKKMLDVSPNRSLADALHTNLGEGYLSAGKGRVSMEQMDVQNMPYGDHTFDVVCCSHVLEHVENDRKALREIGRVLKNDGFAIVLVPIISETTYENPAITDPQERWAHFGDPHHLRRYGKDFMERLRSAGFTVSVVRAADFLHTHEIEKMRICPLHRGEPPAVAEDLIFHCTKTGEQGD